jgi:hypothetical protein
MEILARKMRLNMNANRRNRRLWYLVLATVVLGEYVTQPGLVRAQKTSLGIDCSQLAELQIMKQDNLGAGLAMIECGLAPGGHPTSAGDELAGEAPAPPNILVSNRSCSSASSCTRSESNVWASTKDNGMTIVVNYNDHDTVPVNNYSGTSYSTDGGATFHEILPPPFGSGHGFNLGDPIVVFNSKLSKWFAGDLAGGCGGQGIGLWTSTDGKTWTVGACAHTGGADDRESFWVDNEPSSAKYGRMYISWNNFSFGGALFVTFSDNGTSWSAPKQLSSGFIRDVQITGAPIGGKFGTTSTVFIAAMDEGGGGGATRQNVMYRSLDGGVTWTSVILGPRFAPVGDGTCSSNPYFEKVNPIWRHMGWGEPGVGPNGVVHYAYAAHGTGSDHGDIFYQRSTNNGSTWSAPIKVNQDADGAFKTQWMPSLSVTGTGRVTVSWYDRRNAVSACNAVTDPGCQYERWGRQSKDNGATFLPEFQISTALIPEPDQQDPGVQPCYAGDYDYNTALSGNAYVTWTDGRFSVGGVHVQSVDFSKVPEP